MSLPWSYVRLVSLKGEPPENIDVLELQIHYSPEKPDIVGESRPASTMGEVYRRLLWREYNRASGTLLTLCRSGTKSQLGMHRIGRTRRRATPPVLRV